jgi:C1A family cysteine protease/PKD repeat protein
LRAKILKPLKSSFLIFIVLIFCLLGNSNFAAASIKSPEIQNDTSYTKSAIKAAPINPNFLESQQSDSDEPYPAGNDYSYITGYEPSPVDLSGLSKYKTRPVFGAPELPAAYDLRKEGKITQVKNQGSLGTCWAFSSMASLESCVLGSEGRGYDFSENNMRNLLSNQYPEGFDRSPGGGGNAFMSAAYLSRWGGPLNESVDPYNEISPYSPTGIPAQKHVQEILFLPVRHGPLDNDYLKRALLQYGALYSTLYWSSAYYQQTNHTYMCTNNLVANHAVTLVGWDDSFDRNKFKQVPPGDGAFIVKNSWGESWGEQGYFYISYYDLTFGYDENAVFTSEKQDNYDYVYQYDPLGWVSSLGYSGSPIAWGSNVFSSGRNEILDSIGFYTTDLNTAYDIYVYKNPISGPVSSEKISGTNEKGTFAFPGYHTHILNQKIPLHPGDRFSIVIKFSNPSPVYPLAIELKYSGYSSKAQANPGESYVSPNGISWADMHNIPQFPETNFCIKAFTTVVQVPYADFSSNVTSGITPLTVQFTDLSTNTLSWEWDLNGDGVVDSTARNPIYTYNSQGNYSVSLKTSNINADDSETKNSYVVVTDFSITSANSTGNVTTYQGDLQRFNISTSYTCDVNWYLNGKSKLSDYSVKNSSYSENTLSPGFYNVTVYGETAGQRVTNSWNWIIVDWNPWDNLTSQEGEKISTNELQEAIHIYNNMLPIPETGVELTAERLKELIRLWKTG